MTIYIICRKYKKVIAMKDGGGVCVCGDKCICEEEFGNDRQRDDSVLRNRSWRDDRV